MFNCKRSRVAAFERDIDETVNQPWPPVWKAKAIKRDGAYIFAVPPRSLADALRIIDIFPDQAGAVLVIDAAEFAEVRL